MGEPRRSPRSRSTRPTTARRRPTSFARWRDETPDDFVFAVKASRYATNRKLLRRGRRVDRALRGERPRGTGVEARPAAVAVHADQEVRRRADFEGFLALLPEAGRVAGGCGMRSTCVNESFRVRGFRGAGPQVRRRRSSAATPRIYPMIADVTADFTYARLMRARADVETGLSRPRRSTAWTARSRRQWAERRRRHCRRRSRVATACSEAVAATRSCSSSTVRRNARRPGRWRCSRRSAEAPTHQRLDRLRRARSR